MIIDTLQILAEGGFRIRDYQYTGMGSIYFVDFVLLFRLLGIKRMLSVEKDAGIDRRLDFNKPFANVEVRAGRTIGTEISTLSTDIKHLLWLDYDDRLQQWMTADVISASSRLAPGSVILVTVDVEAMRDSGPVDWKAYYEEQAGDLIPAGTDASQFAQSELGLTNARILFNAFRNGVSGRTDVSFEPLFNFEYRDGHRMLTVGGMLTTASERRALAGCNFEDADYLRRSLDSRPYEIRVPRVTRREKMYLDRHMPVSDGWYPEEFELSRDEIDDFRRIFRYYPSYGELLL